MHMREGAEVGTFDESGAIHIDPTATCLRMTTRADHALIRCHRRSLFLDRPLNMPASMLRFCGRTLMIFIGETYDLVDVR